ncbi:MAG: HPr family phosphocarrier protein [Eubacterium sp.]|nr:HPr family phosphocarrier protein [Eubacterium sp.]
MIKKNIAVNVQQEDARPIAMLVQVASQYKSNINICQDNKTVNAKSIMGMMTLGLASGKELTVSVDGEDETTAMENIENFLLGH